MTPQLHFPEFAQEWQEKKLDEIASFWKAQAFRELCQQEGLDTQKTQALLDKYISTNRLPRNHDISSLLSTQPSVLRRESVLQSIKEKIKSFIETFIEGI